MRSREAPTAIQVSTGHRRGTPGTVAFTHTHRGARSLTIGTGGIDLEGFLSSHPRDWLDA
jgi:hypothetical protein